MRVYLNIWQNTFCQQLVNLKPRGMKNDVRVCLHVHKSTLVYITDNDSRVVGHYAVYISKEEPMFRRSFLPPSSAQSKTKKLNAEASILHKGRA